MTTMVVQQRCSAPSRRETNRPDHGADQIDRATTAFLRVRPRLLGIAHRILRDPFDAESIVQDAWVRWQMSDNAAVVNAEAFLVTTTTRLALNEAQSARRRRETPIGAWLPESPEPDRGPETLAARSDEIERAMVLLLANVTPPGRAAFVLHEAFGYPYARIADLLHVAPANCRQLVRRARRHFAAGQSRPISVTAHRKLVRAFIAAARDGDMAGIEEVLLSQVPTSPTRDLGTTDYDPAAA
jgi:RNA polymerase sigma-70 factor (ECF subfamily)